MRFKCGVDGVYVEGESYLVAMSVSKEKMDWAAELLWSGVYNRRLKEGCSVYHSASDICEDVTAKADIGPGSRPLFPTYSESYYTPQVNDGFNHLSHCESAELVDRTCGRCGKMAEIAAIDVSFDVQYCDKCLFERYEYYGI